MAHSDPMPRDPQGAETRTENKRHREWIFLDEAAELPADFWERITRHPIPPHAGEETKG